MAGARCERGRKRRGKRGAGGAIQGGAGTRLEGGWRSVRAIGRWPALFTANVSEAHQAMASASEYPAQVCHKLLLDHPHTLTLECKLDIVACNKDKFPNFVARIADGEGQDKDTTISQLVGAHACGTPLLCYLCATTATHIPKRARLKVDSKPLPVSNQKRPLDITNAKAPLHLETITHAKAPFGISTVYNACLYMIITCLSSYPASGFSAQSTV